MKRIPFDTFLCVIPLLVLLPWVAAQMDVALNVNHAWLGIAAQRLLAGGTMTGDFYDSNPPLSVLVYIPAALLGKLTGAPYYYMPAITGLFYLALSVFASGMVLKRLPAPAPEMLPIILTAYVMGCTFYAGHWAFAERDAIVLWGLFPFLLAQTALTLKVPLPRRLLWLVLALGAFAILVKPHYGLLPVIVLLHRMVRQKRIFSIIKDADFLALAASVLLYAAVLALFFPDYLRQIAPEMGLYVSLNNTSMLSLSAMVFGVIAVISLAPYFFPIAADYEKPARAFMAAAFCCFALYYIQMKGFYYHLIPLMAFTYIGFALYVQGALIGCFGKKKIVFLCAMILVAVPSRYYLAPGGLITHEAYKKTQLARVAETCAPACAFLAFSENMESVPQISTYTGAEWGSRYPVLWWLPPLHPEYADAPPGKTQERLKHHIDNLAADLNRYKPKIIAVIVNRPLFSSGDHKNFDYIGFLSREPSFAEAMSHYEVTRLIEDDANSYFYENPPPAQKYAFIFAIYERID